MDELDSQYKLVSGGHSNTRNVIVHSLLSTFLYLDTYVWIIFSVNPPFFLIYSSLSHISTFHLYLTNLLS